MNSYCVYRHISPARKVYIGITKQNPLNRWAGGRGYRKNEYFFRAITKYGWDNFAHEILFDGLTRNEACEKEIALIAAHRSNNPEYGYNITTGGDHYLHTAETKKKISEGHKNPSEETRRKIGQASRGRHPSPEALARMSAAQTGRTHTEETRNKISAANKGRKVSEETRQKISEHRKGKGVGPRNLSDSTKALMREHHKGGAESKAVLCVETCIIYKSVNDAARALGIAKSPISKCCRGVPHYNTAGGYHWKWAEIKE